MLPFSYCVSLMSTQIQSSAEVCTPFWFLLGEGLVKNILHTTRSVSRSFLYYQAQISMLLIYF